MALPLFLATAGCGPDAVGAEDELPRASFAALDPTRLTEVSVDDDPLAEHRPDEVSCPPAAFGTEGTGFEVQTGVCNYAAFVQPVGAPLAAGDSLGILVWHDRLDAALPASGHLAVLLDDDVVWEEEVAIPSPSGTFDVLVPVTRDRPDAQLGLHLHNHGFNSWRFMAIDVHPP